MFWYFPAMFLSIRTLLALFFHLCVGALGGRGGGEGVLVKGREGNAGKDGSEGKEKEMGLPLGIGLNVVNGGFTGR